MIYDIDIAKQLSKYLLQINAIILQPDKPFKWAAGWNSPIYCDNRKTLSHPKIRSYIRKNLSSLIHSKYKDIDVIAGVATAGIPHGALIADEMNLPFIYVRSQEKSHGKQNKIEGEVINDQNVVLVEDLISSGKSSIDAAITLRNHGLKVKAITSIFTYGFDAAVDNFKKNNYNFISLCDYNTMIIQALKDNYITEDQLPILEEWRSNPSIWKK